MTPRKSLPPDSDARPNERGTYQLAVENLDFTAYRTSDPVPVGLQFLTVAGLRPPEDYTLFAILPSGDFEDVRLSEPYDLRAAGVEKLVAFKTDRIFRLNVVGAHIAWGNPTISGSILHELAGPGAQEAVFLDVPGGQDRLIAPDDVLDLTQPGVERIIVGPRPVPGFDITVVYNGQPATLRITTGDTVQAILVRSLALFGNPSGDQALFTTAGAELAGGQTAAQAGLTAGSQILLRPRIVRGG